MRSVVIIGSGMAGLTAAIYAAREGLGPLVISGYEPGGQITWTGDVENFPGFADGIKGPELAETMRKQAERFGAEFLTGDVSSLGRKDSHFIVIANDEEIETKTVIIASGASARMLGLDSEKKYVGRGVSTCATCDGAFYRGKTVSVIGGGDSACEEAITLTHFAEKVIIIHRRDALRASRIMQDRARANPKISFLLDTTVDKVIGDGKKVTALKLKNVKTGGKSELPLDGMFLGIGHEPNTSFLKGLVDLDEKGYVKTDRNTRTSIPGIFAAGDIQDSRYRQAVTAAGSGCQAAIEVRHYLEEKGF